MFNLTRLHFFHALARQTTRHKSVAAAAWSLEDTIFNEKLPIEVRKLLFKTEFERSKAEKSLLQLQFELDKEKRDHDAALQNMLGSMPRNLIGEMFIKTVLYINLF